MSWERMGLPKNKGGLGFRDMSIFNKSLLAKQVWRLMQNPSSMVATIYKAIYFFQGINFGGTVGKTPFFCMTKYANRTTCGGKWARYQNLGRSLVAYPFLLCSPIYTVLFVWGISSLWVDEPITKGWNFSLLSKVFNEYEAKTIGNIPLSPIPTQDWLIWRCTTNDVFSVRIKCIPHEKREAILYEGWKFMFHGRVNYLEDHLEPQCFKYNKNVPMARK